MHLMRKMRLEGQAPEQTVRGERRSRERAAVPEFKDAGHELGQTTHEHPHRYDYD